MMAIVFDGSTSVLRSTDFGAARPSAYTVATCVNVDSSASLSAYGAVFYLGNAAGYPNDAGDLSAYYGHFYPDIYGRRATVHTASGSYTGTNTTGSADKGVWRHVCVSYAATRLRYFENGAQIGSTANVTVTASQPADWYLNIADQHNASQKLKCLQAMIAYWDVELNTDEIAALGKGFSPRLIRPQSLKFFVPGLRDANALVGSVGTASSLTFSDDNPRIYA